MQGRSQWGGGGGREAVFLGHPKKKQASHQNINSSTNISLIIKYKFQSVFNKLLYFLINYFHNTQLSGHLKKLQNCLLFKKLSFKFKTIHSIFHFTLYALAFCIVPDFMIQNMKMSRNKRWIAIAKRGKFLKYCSSLFRCDAYLSVC